MNATDRYKVLNNIIAQSGIDGDIYSELAKAESMINALEQGKMMPPPVPQEMTPTSPAQSPELGTISPEMGESMGKYDNL